MLNEKGIFTSREDIVKYVGKDLNFAEKGDKYLLITTYDDVNLFEADLEDGANPFEGPIEKARRQFEWYGAYSHLGWPVLLEPHFRGFLLFPGSQSISVVPPLSLFPFSQ